MQRFNNAEAASIIRQTLLALNFMHKKKIMHRDLKPENILCQQTDSNSDEILVKLTDFGFAAKYDASKQDKT